MNTLSSELRFWVIIWSLISMTVVTLTMLFLLSDYLTEKLYADNGYSKIYNVSTYKYDYIKRSTRIE